MSDAVCSLQVTSGTELERAAANRQVKPGFRRSKLGFVPR
ncbi:MAG: hypothetical protein QOF66_2671 [Mycobacterium sp.]|jgi:hypothetical protein|nr:hypothetical protein [Mycobacterium sp.]